MGKIDIAIYCLLGLSLIFGLIKGVKKNSKFLIFVFSVLIAIYGGIPLGKWISTLPICTEQLNNVFVNIIGDEDLMHLPLSGLNSTEINKLLVEGFKEIHFPSFLIGVFVSRVQMFHGNVAQAISSSFVYMIVVASSVLLIFILSLIVLNIIFSSFKKSVLLVDEQGKSTGFGRLIGMIKSFAFTSLFIYVIMFATVLISQLMMKNNNYTLQNFLVDDLKLLSDNHFSIGKLFYDYSVVFLNWINLKI